MGEPSSLRIRWPVVASEQLPRLACSATTAVVTTRLVTTPRYPHEAENMSESNSHRQTRQHERRTCALCGEVTRDPVVFGSIRPALADGMLVAHPSLTADDTICRKHLTEERTRYVEQLLERERGEISALERQVIESLAQEETIARDTEIAWSNRRTFGERIADYVADFGGSWKFIISFFVILFAWISYNAWSAAQSDPVFDPYPFILLNLVLSCIAAVQAPIIMMSQKRQEAKDRLRSENDYRVNLKAELEIRHLHEKLDHLISRQWERLAEIQQIQLEIMTDISSNKQ